MEKLDGRTRQARLLKARKDRKAIFKQIKQIQVQIEKPEFDKVLKEADFYYAWKYKDSWDILYTYLTRNALINYLRHQYSNYHECLEIYRQLQSIPFTYRLMLGYNTELKAYNWIKWKFNRLIEKECQELLKKFEVWQDEIEKK